MTLPRSNPGRGGAVIDRNDDSPRQPVRVAAIGRPGVFLDVLLEALRASAVDAWRIDPGTLETPYDQLRLRTADLVLLDVSSHGYTDDARVLIHRLARKGLLVVVLDSDTIPRPGHLTVEAGALWALNPGSAAIEDLADVIHQAEESQRAAEHERQRAHRAREAWDEAAHNSSILTMRGGDALGEDVPERTDVDRAAVTSVRAASREASGEGRTSGREV